MKKSLLCAAVILALGSTTIWLRTTLACGEDSDCANGTLYYDYDECACDGNANNPACGCGQSCYRIWYDCQIKKRMPVLTSASSCYAAGPGTVLSVCVQLLRRRRRGR
jgi:hypothetical protein